MADATTTPCAYSTRGHLLHLIQIKLAHRSGVVRHLRIVEATALGVRVAPLGDPTAVETWCMHAPHRDVVRAAIARGDAAVLARSHGLAEIGGHRISYTSPEEWRECPAFEDLRYWEKPYVTREEIEAEIAAGRGKPEDYR